MQTIYLFAHSLSMSIILLNNVNWNSKRSSNIYKLKGWAHHISLQSEMPVTTQMTKLIYAVHSLKTCEKMDQSQWLLHITTGNDVRSIYAKLGQLQVRVGSHIALSCIGFMTSTHPCWLLYVWQYIYIVMFDSAY